MVKISEHMISIVTAFLLFISNGLCETQNGLYSEESWFPIPIEECHQSCISKFATDDMTCLQTPECSMCWDECTATSNINKSILDTWSLSVTSMVRDNSLVSTTIDWNKASTPRDCLVTWEVFGGGLIGNLLTQSSNVELSLWPDTKYRVQVTCKNKQNGDISRSLPLTLDTSKALSMVRVPTLSTSTLTNDDSAKYRILLNERIFKSQSPFSSTSSFMFALNTNDIYPKVLLGSFVSITVFLTVLLAFIISRRKSRTSIDKAPLVDNEVSVDIDRLTIHV